MNLPQSILTIKAPINCFRKTVFIAALSHKKKGLKKFGLTPDKKTTTKKNCSKNLTRRLYMCRTAQQSLTQGLHNAVFLFLCGICFSDYIRNGLADFGF